ncbi:MAG: hypothetical protein U5K00_06370 [Melioribacteraceae bacterium]|nr:hypothetical protein [Melioribacteraceae bacterium]
MQLFVAEVPGPTKDKIHPRVKETAKRLWGIYLILTATEAALLVDRRYEFVSMRLIILLRQWRPAASQHKQDSIAAL